MTPNPYNKQYLMTAGPTPVPPRVLSVMAEPVLYHRAPAGVEVTSSVPFPIAVAWRNSRRAKRNVAASCSSSPLTQRGSAPSCAAV